MIRQLTSGIGPFRVIAFLEGISMIVLVFIAMPLKYLFDNPQPVRVIGMAHGILFILFVIMALGIWRERGWKPGVLALVLLSSIVPFGTFYMDRKLLSRG